MRFLKDKLVIILIIFVTIGASAALIISISISSIVVNSSLHNKDQEASLEQKTEQSNLRPVNMAKAEEYKLFYNGQIIDDFNAYIVQKQRNLIPVDAFLKIEGGKLNYYAPDDLASATIFGKRTMFWLGKSTYIDKTKIKTAIPPFVYNKQLFIDSIFLEYFSDFQLEVNENNGVVFVNNYHKLASKIPPDILVLANNKKELSLTNLEKTVIKWETDADTAIIETNTSLDGSVILLKTVNEVYLIELNNFSPVMRLNVPVSAKLTADAKYIYWWENTVNLVVYDILKGERESLGNFILDPQSLQVMHSIDNSSLSKNYQMNQLELYEYKKNSDSISITLTDSSNQEYLYVKSRNKILIEGNVIFSPDRTRIIYQKADKGFISAKADGTQKTFLSNATKAEWINNKAVLLYNQKSKYIVNVKTKLMYATEAEWKQIGSTPYNDVFYQKDLMLICESKGVGKEIGSLPWKCEKVRALSEKGPYLLYCKEQDGIFYYEKGLEPRRIGTISKLYDSNIYKDGNDTQNVAIAPDNNTIAVLEQDDSGLGKLKLVQSKVEKNKTLTLNLQNKDLISLPKMKWLNKELLLVYADNKIWIVNVKNKIELKSWTLSNESVIQFVK